MGESRREGEKKGEQYSLHNSLISLIAVGWGRGFLYTHFYTLGKFGARFWFSEWKGRKKVAKSAVIFFCVFFS